MKICSMKTTVETFKNVGSICPKRHLCLEEEEGREERNTILCWDALLQDANGVCRGKA